MNLFMWDNFCSILKLQFHRMEDFCAANGYEIVRSPENADVIVVGVCAAFEADEQRSCQMLRQQESLGRPMYVFGCMVTVSPQKIRQERFFPTWEYGKLLRALVPSPTVSWGQVKMPADFRVREDYRIYNAKKKYVGVSFGCGFDCSFCPHKLGVGRLVSRSIDDILSQIQGLLQSDVETIVLTGTDTASYGREIGTSFPDLLMRILALPNNNAVYHVAQFNPEGIRREVERRKLVRSCWDERVTDFQLPIQTASDRLLKLMNRRYRIADVADFVESVRLKNRNLFLRTDLLVGFPTETEKELDDSIVFAARHFNEVTVYGYEYKAGTPIGKSGLPFFGKDVIRARVDYAREQIRQGGRLVHSGGQDITSLLISDLKKESLRR